jgi:hypothetical protein
MIVTSPEYVADKNASSPPASSPPASSPPASSPPASSPPASSPPASSPPASPPAAASTTYYVSKTGSDSNPGTLAQPYKTITHAVGLLHPGDTLYVRAGTYAESFNSNIPGGTSWSAPVTVAAYPGETVILQPNKGADRVFTFASSSSRYISIEGFILNAVNVNYDAIKITAGNGVANHIRIKNCEVMNAPQQGILVTQRGADYNQFINLKVHDNGTNNFGHGMYIENNYNLVDGCDLYNNAGYGIQVYKGGGINGQDAGHNTIQNTSSHDNGRHGNGGSSGIGVFVGDGNQVLNCRVWNNPRGIVTDYGATNSLFSNDTVFNSTMDAGIYIGSGSTNATVQDNHSYSNPGGDFHNGGTGTVQINNVFN